jgi:hypothetical protein
MPALPRIVQSLREMEQRERRRVVTEVMAIRGLMPLLMKPRNGQKWSGEDWAQMRQYLKRLGAVSPYLFAVMLPAAPVTLPVLAWWLDRRRTARNGPLSGSSSGQTIIPPP